MECGDLAVELDALAPPILQQVVRDAIISNLDMNTFASQKVIQDQERDRLQDLRDDILAFIENQDQD